jgi:ribose 5-phosphate isomerase B
MGTGRSSGARDGAPQPSSIAPSPAPGTARPALRIAIAADHGGVTLKETILERLHELGHSVVDHGTSGTEPVDYPDFALRVAREVSSGAAQLGIMVDGAGIGSCMVANKVRGVRAAMCHDVTTAANAREHNNANVLTLGGGLIGPRLALEIVERFLGTDFAGGRHARRVEKIDALDASEGRTS